jgi:precorrin-6A/cobalt-precorrin-6A reductase
MKAIIIIAGTQDARRIIEALQSLKLQIHATVATELGRVFLEAYPHIRIHSGRRDAREMAELIRAVRAVALIDASHPFAAAVSANAISACRDTGVAYLRYEREATPGNAGNLIPAADFNVAAAQVAAFPGNILLTIGSNHLETFVAAIPDYRERLYVRVLPESRVLAKCEACGLTARQIFALQGPFTEMMNLELYRHCRAAVIVTKDSGATGGNPEKISAAARLKLPVIMVARPSLDYGRKVTTIPEVVTFAKTYEIPEDWTP